MTSWGSYSYAFGPLVAFAGVLVAIALLRWAFHRDARDAQNEFAEDEVLAPLLGPHTWGEVNRVSRQLDQAGIPHRVVDLRTSYQLQVPADELAAARAVLAALG